MVEEEPQKEPPTHGKILAIFLTYSHWLTFRQGIILCPEEKKLYVWQGFHGKIELVSFNILNSRTVLQVALGGEHSLFLTDTDEVYSCGSNKSRQLGVASLDVQYSFDPCLVQDVSGKHVIHIACGSSHSACVCSDGLVYTWGDSKAGQCGLDIKDAVVTSPSLVDLTHVTETWEGEAGHTHIIQVACGATHTLALTNKAEVVVWGSGCQLGLGSETLFSKPAFVPGLEGRRVLKVYCGDYHSALLVEKSDLPIPKSPSKRVSNVDSPGRKSSPRLIPHTPARKSSSGSNEVVDRGTQSSEDLSSHHEGICTTVSDSKTNIQEIEQRDSEHASDNSPQPVSDVSKEKYGNEPLEPVIGEMNQKDSNVEGSSQITLSAMPDSHKGDSGTVPDSKSCQIIPTVEESLNSQSAMVVSGRDEGSIEDQGGQGSNIESNTTTLASVLDSKAAEHEESVPLMSKVSRSRSFLDEEQARKYLAKQFETDEFQAVEKLSSKSLEKRSKDNASFSPSILGSGVFEQVTSLTSHMTSQVSSMTSKAFSTLKSTVTGTLSVGGTTGVVEKSPRKASGENYDILSDLELKAIDSLNESDLDISLLGVTDSVTEDASGTGLTSLVESTTDSLDVSTNIDRRKSCSLRTLEAREEQLRKKSVPSTTGDVSWTVNADIGIIDTEVWSWGKNTKGQLGHGDMIDRCEPCCIQMLTEKQIVKLGLGSQHTLALTARGEVYSWGLNNCGQLGHAEISSTAFKIKLGPGLSVWDIAAGETHSILLVDNQSDQTARPDVYYIGKHPSKDLYVPVFKTQKPIQLNFVKKAGWINSLGSGGDHCACIAFGGSKRSQVMFDFARWHRQFYFHLDMIERLLLKPLQSSKFYTELDNCPQKTMLEDIISVFKILCQKVGQASSQLAECIRDSKNIFGASVFAKFEVLIDSFKKYSTAFSDMLATGGFEFCGKNGSSTFEKFQQSFRILLKKDKLDSPNYAVIFKETLQFPLVKMSEYAKLLAGFADLYPKDSKENDLLSCLALNWEHLDRISNTELGIADNTRCFWETCPSKFTADYGYFHSTQTFVTTTDTQLNNPKENLKTATRRLLRESKTHPLTQQSGGRFSTHVFYLFTDLFVHYQNSTSQVYPLEMVWIETSTESDSQKNLIIMKTPEETLALNAPSSAAKVEWLMSLNSAISKVLADHKPLPESRHTSSDRLTPPVIRYGTHTFTKPGPNKDAVYTGYWISGTMHGMGQMKWSDGRCYTGKFKNGQQTGYGKLIQPIGDKFEDVLEGTWKNGKLHGFGNIRYGNGDLYEGYFKEGRKWGHGTYRKGRKITSASFIYIGEWIADKKHGYGVMDDILKGEKYLGMWQEDNRHGDGIVVTLDGMYFEGNFQGGKMIGFGLMVTDDSSIYEGEFSGITQLQGKGTLTFPNGDKIEGAFTGSWNEGLKINGSFIKSSMTKSISSTGSVDTKSSYFGKLSVRPDRKWDELFYHCHTTLHYNRDGEPNTKKAWEAVAVILVNGRKRLRELEKSSNIKSKVRSVNFEQLEKIPPHGVSCLTLEHYKIIKEYLEKAFSASFHPLGKLIEGLVDVFRAAYIGIGAHPRLLFHALSEVQSFIKRLYHTVRILFPELPDKLGPTHVYREGILKVLERQISDEDENMEIITAPLLIQPILLPKIYPALFDLYALNKDKDDEKYWERVQKLNRQGDIALMSYLGADQKFWCLKDLVFAEEMKWFSNVKDKCYTNAVEILQQISTAFCPQDKLEVIQKTCLQITQTIQSSIGEGHVWCMDDLFPVFQFVVIRAKIHHLGAEIQFIEDLMEPHLEFGELGLMFTTLKFFWSYILTTFETSEHFFRILEKHRHSGNVAGLVIPDSRNHIPVVVLHACYYQIQNEKMPTH